MSRDEWILYQDDKRRAKEAKEYERRNKKPSKQQAYRILKRIGRWN